MSDINTLLAAPCSYIRNRTVLPHERASRLDDDRRVGVALDPGRLVSGGGRAKSAELARRWPSHLAVHHFSTAEIPPDFLVCEDLGRWVPPASPLTIARLNFLYS
jgi:sugar phosphate isomerase/epimerase